MTAAALDGTTSSLTTGASDTHREELDDVIHNIDKERNVFTTSIKKGTCKTKYVEWPEDEDEAAESNAQVEGADAEYAELDMPDKYSNRIQILAEWFMISDIQESIDKAGRKSEIAYKTKRKLRKIAKDKEYAALNNLTAVALAAGTAGKMKGLKGFISDNTYDFSASYATSNLITFDLINDQMEAAAEDYGDPTLILAPPKQKRRISEFDQNNRITINADAKEKKILAAVDFIETDFGVVRVKLCYGLTQATDSSKLYDFLPIIDPSGWELLTLKGHGVKVEKLARTGLAQKIQISTVCSLKCFNEKRNAMISKLYAKAA
jgi:hypothetical protein